MSRLFRTKFAVSSFWPKSGPAPGRMGRIPSPARRLPAADASAAPTGAHGATFQQLPLALRQQSATVLAGLLCAQCQPVGINSIGVAGQAAACGGELLQHLIYAATLGTDGRKGNGVFPGGNAGIKLVLLYLFHREEQGTLLLPCAVDLVGQFAQPAFLGSSRVTPEKSEVAMPCRAARYRAFGSGMVGRGSPAVSR